MFKTQWRAGESTHPFSHTVKHPGAAEVKTWAEHLATTGEFAHDTAIFPTRGENIAQGAAGFHSTEQLMQGWVPVVV
jgi:hypothetical protein